MFPKIKALLAARKAARTAKITFSPTFWEEVTELSMMLLAAASDRHITEDERTALKAQLQVVVAALVAAPKAV